jgi:molybdate transport system substrate-binding protein
LRHDRAGTPRCPSAGNASRNSASHPWRQGAAWGVLPVLALIILARQAAAAEIHVMISGGFSAPFEALVPRFERQTGDTVVAAHGPSMGTTPNAIPVRLARGEVADVIIMARSALDALVKEGRIAGGTEVDLVRSRIGMAVKAGNPVPDISTVEALKQTLLKAHSIA